MNTIREAEQIQRECGYDRLCIVSHRDEVVHKIHRTAREMNVDLDGDIHTEVYYNPAEAANLAANIKLPEEYVFFHGATGAAAKNLPRWAAQMWLDHRGFKLPVVSPDTDWDIGMYPISVTMHIMKQAKVIIVADSVMYHIAHALDLRVHAAYFSNGKAVWDKVRPLHQVDEKVYYDLRGLCSAEN